MTPLLPLGPPERPWHSNQYQALPLVHVQNASLEIAWTRVVAETGTISGQSLAPFVSEGYEGFDVNEPIDWIVAETLLASADARLADVPYPPYPHSS
jgi:N-acylneuraminate cytidylyltransferase